MIEIFVPFSFSDIKLNSQKKNKFLANFDIKIEDFNRKNFNGIKLFCNEKNIDDVIIFCNGTFGNNYFLSSYNKKSNGINLDYQGNLDEKIKYIYSDINKIIKDLKSDLLLTKTKKENIIIQIKNTIFNISGIEFVLYNNLLKIEENLGELDILKQNKKAEFSSQSIILKENLLTQKSKIENILTKLELTVEDFLKIINKIIN